MQDLWINITLYDLLKYIWIKSVLEKYIILLDSQNF